jgi:hypothetical protein
MKEESKKTLAEQAAERDKGLGEGQREGDFVLQGQELADKEGFGHVSKIWYKKTLPVADVVESLRHDAMECMDLEVPPELVVLSEDGTLQIEGQRLKFSHHAARTICEWAKLPSGTAQAFLGDGDDEGKLLFARSVNRGLNLYHEGRENKFKLRLRGETIRAFVSESFAAIDNLWGMELLAGILPGARVSHFRYDGDSMSGLMLIPDTIRTEKDSDYGGGIHFKNSEIGKARLVTRPSVFRAICMNGCIWGEMTTEALVQKRHRGTVDLKDIADAVYASIQKTIPVTSKCIDQMLATHEIDLEDKITCIKIMARVGKGISQDARRQWVGGWIEEGQETSAFGVVQGLTRAGRDRKSADEAMHLELTAGDLVSWNERKWNQEAEYAGEAMSEKELMAILGETLYEEALA